MPMRLELPSARIWLATLICLSLCCELSRAAAPQVKYLYPAGGQRGQTVEIDAPGKFDAWPVNTWVDRPGLEIIAKPEQGKLTATVAADAVPGLYWIRVYDAQGATPPLPFLIGTLPEVLEQEPNDHFRHPQKLSSSTSLINGRLQKRGDVDVFAVELQKGQTLVAAIEAHRTLGAPLDAVLEVVSTTGFVLARNDDDHGLDPRVIFTAPESGTYLVRTFGFPAVADQSISLAGGENFVYRLTVTTGGFYDYAFPLSVSHGDRTELQLFGWNLTDALKRQAIDAASDAAQVTVFHPELANSLVLPVEPHRSISENGSSQPDQSQAIELPVTITGQIGQPRERDQFCFTTRAGEQLSFRVESRALGFPLDPVLELFDSSGKSLARVDDAGSGRDVELAFTVPAEGRYRAAVYDLHQRGGSRYVYRLSAVQVKPDFRLTVPAAGYVVENMPVEIPVTVERLNGFNGEIAIEVMGLPPTATSTAVRSLSEGDTAKAVKVLITSAGSAFSGPIRIVGHAMASPELRHPALAPIPGHAVQTEHIWLTVLPEPKQ